MLVRCVTGAGVCVCGVQFGTVEARAYISGSASWRADLCGMGAGLHGNHVPGLRGGKRSATGTRVPRARASGDFQASWDLESAGRAALPQKRTFINFFSEEARSFVVCRKKRKRVARSGGQEG